MKSSGTFSNGHLAVFPAEDTTCATCKSREGFTRLYKPRGKNLSIVDSRTAHDTD